MLQQVNVKLKVLENTLLKYDYNYALGCELNKKITLVDSMFAEVYHKEGLRNSKSEKPFKLLNPLFQFKDVIMDKEGIILNKDTTIILSLKGHKQIIGMILNGFMQDNMINIDGVRFEYTGADIVKLNKFDNMNSYKVETALIETIQDENKNTLSLDIMNPKYVQLVKNNLLKKYNMIYNKEYTGDLKIGIEDFMKIKNKSINIKGYFIQGYGKFNVIIQANKDMQKVAYYCGLGTHNMYGGGYLKLLK